MYLLSEDQYKQFYELKRQSDELKTAPTASDIEETAPDATTVQQQQQQSDQQIAGAGKFGNNNDIRLKKLNAD